jgi:soluble lytic murein transglycosylase-like protein
MVEIRDNFVVAARDRSGRRWKAGEPDVGPRYPRLLTHLLIVVLAAQAISLIPASGQPASAPRQRLSLAGAAAVRSDAVRDGAERPETPRSYPLAAPPPPPPPPPPAPPPPPKPRPVYVPVSQQAVANIIRAAAAKYGVDPDRLLRVAMCESGLNPNAVSRNGAEGLFQFKPGTFYGHGGHNIWDPADQADVAAKMFAQGLAYEWVCR